MHWSVIMFFYYILIKLNVYRYINQWQFCRKLFWANWLLQVPCVNCFRFLSRCPWIEFLIFYHEFSFPLSPCFLLTSKHCAHYTAKMFYSVFWILMVVKTNYGKKWNANWICWMIFTWQNIKQESPAVYWKMCIIGVLWVFQMVVHLEGMHRYTYMYICIYIYIYIYI